MAALVLLSLIAFAFAEDLPQQIHLAFGASSEEMTATWFREGEDLVQVPIVMYGLESQTYEWNATGVFYPYSIASGWKGRVHTATMKNLTSDTEYFYRCGDAKLNKWSEEFSFRTPLPTGPTKTASRFAVYGDMGLGGNTSSDATVKSILMLRQKNLVDVVLHVGDIAYCDTDHEKKGDQKIWSAFLNEIQPIAANTAYMTCPGNHDVFYDTQPYSASFPMPVPKKGAHWYTFDYENIRFISINTEDSTLLSPTLVSEQREWMRAELEKYQKDPNRPSWLIVYAHRPIYCSSTWEWCQTNIKRKHLSDAIESLLQDYNVDLFIAGHTHSYERSHPVYDGKIKGTLASPQATVHLTIGTPGDREGLDKHAWKQPRPAWSAFRRKDLGWGLMTVHNQTHIQWQFKDSKSTKTVDEFWLKKGKW
eukprot:TRINITY_DN430_c0_g2_i1.p1 TRINITY_DN430_c0_g2~~TRINITY_DN430_c0_g2_i1.p1  ORF type:complete len:421 (+),score=59.35 TRINITY_DN430_c0_g2_i1:27-1289(+)